MPQKPINVAPAALEKIARAINDLAKKVKPLQAGAGIKVTESTENILIARTADQETQAGLLPEASEGDMLYHDGEGWVVLPNPGTAEEDWVLRHNGIAPYWSASLAEQVTEIEDRLDAASISATCNEDGTITVTLTL